MNTLRTCIASVVVALLLIPSLALAHDELPLPLQNADPKKPLEVLADATWTLAQLNAPFRSPEAGPDLATVTYDDAKGPITLVVDLATVRTSKDKGHARIDLGIECVAPAPCPIDAAKSVMGMDTQFMGESVAILDSQPTPVLVQRRAYSYVFKPGTVLSTTIQLGAHENLDPKLVRARWIYGQFDDAGVPGQTTRKDLLMKILATVTGLFIVGVWWMRRA